MKTRIDKKIKGLFDKTKLKLKFRDSNSFATLAELFPKLYVPGTDTGDTLIPVYRDKKTNEIKEVFEDKQFIETLGTLVIPVQYRSSYARGIAQGTIRNAFIDYQEFFKTFLDGYDKINLDDEVYESGSFPIDDYNTNFYTLDKLMEIVLRKYGVSEDLIPKIIESIKNNGKISDLDTELFKKMFKEHKLTKEDVILYYARRGNAKLVKKTIDMDENKYSLVREFFTNSSFFSFFNSVLNSDCIDHTFFYNSKLIEEAINKHNSSTKEEDIENSSCTYVDRIDSINAVRVILKTLDPSEKLSSFFEDKLHTGNLMTFSFDNKTKQDFEFFKTNSFGDITTFSDKEVSDSNEFISVDFNDNITDIYELVNKIVLGYIHKENGTVNSDLETLFTNYFETLTRDYLLANSTFTDAEIKKSYDIRRLRDIRHVNFHDDLVVAKAVNRKNENGILTLKDISNKESKDEQKSDVIKTAASLFRFQQDFNLENLMGLVGTYFGEEYKEKEFRTHVVEALDAYSTNRFDNSQIVSRLNKCHKTDDEIGIDPSVMWRTDLEDIVAQEGPIVTINLPNNSNFVQYVKGKKTTSNN